jgi:hypothetical protein
MMRGVKVIVARDRPELYEYFKQGFDGIAGVEVILDRRVVVGRGGQGVVDPERRRDLDVYDELALRGFIIRPTPP